MQNGACYIRVSTDDQTEYSPDAQLRALKDYAKKNDIILSKQHIYIDEGISGKTANKRPAFMEMIATAKSKPKPFDVIIVHKFDRFARSREDSVVYKSLLRKEAGIKVVSITETIEDDKFAVILEAMLEAMAEYYSLNLADEVKKGMTEKAQRGEYQTYAPFGYVMTEKNLVIDAEKAKYIQVIFNKFANHEMGYLSLAKYMNDLGIKTTRGNLFENRTIEYMLNNPVYIGKTRWTPTGKTRRNYHNPDSIIAEGNHEPIIDMETWNKTQEHIKELKEMFGKREKSTAKINSWLKGLIKCGNCGKSLVNQGNYYFQCNGYAKGTCKISHTVRISVLEEMILEEIKKIYTQNLEINITPKQSDILVVDEYELLIEILEKNEAKEIRIKEAYQDGIDTLEEYKENKKKLEAEKEKINIQLKSLKTKLKGDDLGNNDNTIIKQIENAYTLLRDENIDLEIKYQTAHFLINKAVYHKKEKTLSLEFKG